LRHCATSHKVTGSILDGIIGIFHLHNPSGRTKALGSTQPLTEMSTRNISWGCKSGRYVGLTTLPPSCTDCLEIWEPRLPGTLWACIGIHLPFFTYVQTLGDFTDIFQKRLMKGHYYVNLYTGILCMWFSLSADRAFHYKVI